MTLVGVMSRGRGAEVVGCDTTGAAVVIIIINLLTVSPFGFLVLA